MVRCIVSEDQRLGVGIGLNLLHELHVTVLVEVAVCKETSFGTLFVTYANNQPSGLHDQSFVGDLVVYLQGRPLVCGNYRAVDQHLIRKIMLRYSMNAFFKILVALSRPSHAAPESSLVSPLVSKSFSSSARIFRRCD